MRDRIKQLIIWASVSTFLMLIDKALDYPRWWIWKVLPTAILRLDANMLRGLAITFTASLLAWLFGIASGYLLGCCAGAAVLDSVTGMTILRRAGQLIDKAYSAVYVIPFVLTASLTFTLAMKLYVGNSLPSVAVMLVLIAVAGSALGGYHVYKAVYDSVRYAGQDTAYLVRSLYCPHEQSLGLLRRAAHSFHVARRFRDCEIRAFCGSVSKALYLAVVSVMIVETIAPLFYELVVPQTGAIKSWLGGAGRQILEAQSTYDFQRIAGCIWAVLFFVFFVDTCIGLVFRRRWLQHYGGAR